MPLDKKTVLRLSKGFQGRAKNCYRIAKTRVLKALVYQTESRREKKRDIRKVWIQKIGAGAREHGLNYNTFISGLKQENVWLDRKILSNLAAYEPMTFKALTHLVTQRQQQIKLR